MWLKTLKHRTHEKANDNFTKWLNKTDHRSHSYKIKTCSCLPEIPKITTKATWLSLPLEVPIQQCLLQCRTLATRLETHTPPSRRGLEGYEESFCPLCLALNGAHTPDEHTDTMTHCLWDCEHLCTEQLALALHATQFVLDNGGIPGPKNTMVTLQWSDLCRKSRLGLLMGNHLPEINHISNDYTEVQKWLAGFLEAVDTPLHTLFT